MTMQSQEKGNAVSSQVDVGRYVFIAVGLAIVLGGLWPLSDFGGPYHPAPEGGEIMVPAQG